MDKTDHFFHVPRKEADLQTTEGFFINFFNLGIRGKWSEKPYHSKPIYPKLKLHFMEGTDGNFSVQKLEYTFAT